MHDIPLNHMWLEIMFVIMSFYFFIIKLISL